MSVLLKPSSDILMLKIKFDANFVAFFLVQKFQTPKIKNNGTFFNDRFYSSLVKFLANSISEAKGFEKHDIWSI